MNLQIFLKVLEALSAVTDFDISGNAIALTQALELLAHEPGAAAQLNQIIAGSVCCDWPTFNQVAQFVAQCLAEGKQANLPRALQTFERIASESSLAA